MPHQVAPMVHSWAVPWVMVPVILVCLVAMVAIVANAIAATVRANAETVLKRRMVEQGYPADEIVRVIRARPQDLQETDDQEAMPRKPSKPPRQFTSVL